MKRPITTDLYSLVADIYARNPMGCCLHIAISDENIDNAHIEFCIYHAVENGHLDCEHVSRLLLLMSRTQRKKVCNNWSHHKKKLRPDPFGTEP